MKLNVVAFGLAAGIVAAVLYVICALLVTLAPGTVSSVAEILIHLNLSGMVRIVAWGNFLGGLVCWFLLGFFSFSVGAMMYNKMVEK